MRLNFFAQYNQNDGVNFMSSNLFFLSFSFFVMLMCIVPLLDGKLGKLACF
jgi:hypothetical protein|tara:strand:- start:360 stop:512 length:153 start_codon:yes stop_codon:yes gene_type:complete